MTRQTTILPSTRRLAAAPVARLAFAPLALAPLAFALALLCLPAPAHAQDDEGPRPVVDARLEGLVDPASAGTDGDGSSRARPIVTVDKDVNGGFATTWLLFVVLTGVAAGVMLKDAKRSHLD